MLTTHEAPAGLYRDEPEPIAPLLAVSGQSDEPTVPTRERLALLDDRLFVFVEDEGGGIYSERDLGPLLDVSDWDVPEGLREEFYRLVQDERDAIEYGAACRAEALRRY